MAEERYQKTAGTFVAVLLHSSTIAHFLHLQSKSYSEHKALAKYYDGIIGLADRYAEAFQGAYSVIDKYPSDFHAPAKQPVQYIEKIKEFVDASRKSLPDDSQLQNVVDEIVELLDSTLYKLRNLK
jgi:hypothetical protein